MRRLLPLLLLVAACGKGGSSQNSHDRGLFQEILEGAITPQDGMVKIAQSGGWPIATQDGYLFATLDAGLGPYMLVSLDGSFQSVKLKSESGVAWAVVGIAHPDGARYDFQTAFNDPVHDTWSRDFLYASGTTVSLVAASGAHLERWPQLSGTGVAARTVRVWVPATAPDRFLYVHDGQNLFDPAGPYGGWRLQDAAGPTTLVVGIDNTADRVSEYTPVTDSVSGLAGGGNGAAYADYVEQVVRPFIEARYGTPARTGVMGSSLGGLISLYEVLRFPGRYDFAASLSGTLGWGSIGADQHQETIIDSYRKLTACPSPVLYLDSGGGPGSGCVDADGDGIQDDAPDASDNYCENVQMKGVLETLGCGDRLTYVWASGAQHNEEAWRTRAPAILAIFEAL